MKILNIEFIFLMLVPSFFLLYLIITNKSELERIFDKDVLNRIRIDRGIPKNRKLFILFLALFLMIFALSRPVIEKGVVEVEVKRKPIVLALDISKSMLAQDLFPNRLEFAKNKMIQFIKRSKEFDIAVIAFAKDAFIVSLLSSDKEAILFLIKNLDTKSITLQGTNFLPALETAAKLLKKENIKNILIFSDGGDKSDFSKEIDFAKKENLRVYMLGFGSQKGAPIPQNGGYLKDKNQNIVITRLNKNFQRLTTKSGGKFIVATNGTGDIDKILKLLDDNKKKVSSQKITLRIEFYPYILAFALILLFVSFFSFKRSFFIFMLLFLFNPKIEAGIFDFKDIKEANEYYKKKKYEKAAHYFKKVANSKKSSQSFYNLANAYYKAKKYKEAIRYYNLVQTPNSRLRRYVLHNLGNSYFMLKDYKKAIEFYEKALEIEFDKDTKYNLDLAKKMLNRVKNSSGKKDKKNKLDKKSGKSGDSSSKQNKDRAKKDKSNNLKKDSVKKRVDKNLQNRIISKREEKKWLNKIKQTPQKTLLFKYDTKNRGDFSENPW